MSNLSYIEKLLDGTEVAWWPLGEAGTFSRGNGLQKKDFNESGVGCIHYGQIYTHYGIAAEQTKTFVSEDIFKKAKKAKKGDLIIADTSENDEDLCKAVAWLGDEEIAISNHTFIYTHSLHPKYVSYFLQTEMFHKQKRPFITGAKVRSISAGNMAKIEIPIPCPEEPEKSLEIQAEIVRILDAFTSLTAELTAELTARKKQYNHYRHQVLTFDEGDFAWKPLGEVAKVQRGASPRPISKYITDDEDGVPWIKIGDTSSGSKYVEKTAQKITKEGAKKSRLLKKCDFIISNSMSFGRPYILNIDGAIHDGWASLSSFEESLNSDFLYHFLASDAVQNYWLSKINSGSVSNLNADIIRTLLVPIPCPDDPRKSLEIQAEIVTILDKFDALTNSIQEGLPREIKLRQQQYEYYRDLLLNFPKPEETA